MSKTDSIWVVFLGAPGCGKGTQAEYLIAEKSFASISVGDLLRSNKNKKVHGDKTIGELIDSGSLLPDDVVIDLVRDEANKLLSDGITRILFDGFPRTIGQAVALSELAKEFESNVDKVLNFVVEDDIITKRILGRYRCASCGKIYNKFFLTPKVDGVCDVCQGVNFEHRADDNEESLKKRLSEYHDKTYPLIDFYSKAAVLYSVEAERDFDEVRDSVLKILNV